MAHDAVRPVNGVKSVDRALDLLDLLALSAEDKTASELSRASRLPYATVHRLLGTLAQRGYVRQDPASKAYSLGPKLVLGGVHVGRLLGRWASPFLTELMEFSGETANLAVLDEGFVTYVAQVQSRSQLRMFTEVGNRVLPHATAVGKVLLAFQDRSEVEANLRRRGLPPRTDHTITDPDEFLLELDRVEAAGFAVDDEEGELGVRCVAVPLLRRGEAVAALSVSGPAGRLEPEKRSALVPRMREIACELAASLGPDDGATAPEDVDAPGAEQLESSPTDG